MKRITSIYQIISKRVLIGIILLNVSNLSAQLSGSYTIGTGGDYTTIQSAVTALTSSGVSAPVTFNILSGVYYERVIIPEISGASATNTITIQSQAMSADSVIWAGYSQGWNSNYILRFNGADHIIAKHLTFRGPNSYYNRKIDLTGAVDSVKVDSCNFRNSSNYTGGVGDAVWTGSGPVTGFHMTNCDIQYGQGINITSYADMSNVQFINNTISHVTNGIVIDELQDSLNIIRGNRFTNISSYGIYVDDSRGHIIIEDNHIYCPDATYGIYISAPNNSGSAANRSKVINNLITAEDIGMFLYGLKYYDIYHNTVHVRDSYALKENGGNSTNLRMKNNIFSTEANQAAIYFQYGVGDLTSDYNNLYTTYTYPVYYYYSNRTLAQWQSSYGQGENSLTLEPIFDGDSTLVPLTSFLDNQGTPIASVADDINGVARSDSTPDMGAHEFTSTATPISGIVSVGPSEDYSTIHALRQDLAANGVNGPLTVNIASGTYNENISFGEINGASATNTITLQSAALSADSVVWQNNSNNYSKNYAVNLDGTDHMRFKHITFSGTVASYSRQMVVTGVVDSLVVDSCHFETNATSVGSNSNYTSFYGYNAYLSGLQITNSTFENTHHYAIYIDANAVTPRPSNIEISNNRFINMYDGIFVDYHDKVSIRNNTMSNSISMGSYGIYLNQVDSATVIENNRIYDPENTLSYGIYLSGCNASEENPGRIINNIIQSNTHGIYMWSDVSYYNLYHNTIYTHSSNPLHIYYYALHLSIKNNIFMSDGATSYIYLGNNSSYVSSAYLDMDYNNIFFSNSSYSPFRVSSANYTLSTWQSTFGQDSNSVITDPYFTDSTLVPFSPWMDNMGTPISGITLDINGATRSETTPDVGAAEFTGFSGSPLSGSYTIGTGGNYTSMDTLQRDLTLLGINGPVVLNFLEGTHTEPLALSEVRGSSALNTITFQSADQNASSVNWQRASISTDNYTNSYILKLNGTDHVKIKHMTFQVTGGYHISKLRLSGQTDSISVDSVTFIDTYSSNGRSGYGIYSTSGNPVIGVSVKNCSFTNTPGTRYVSYGTEITFSSDQINTSIESGLEISNNTLLNSYRGIYIYKYNGITVRGNTIRGDGQNDKGLNFGYLRGNGIIENNSIYGPETTSGMYFDYCYATNDTTRISVVNNRILTEDYGIYSNYSNYTDFYYNTIHTRDEYPLYAYYNQNINLKNNIFSVDENNASKVAAYFTGYYTFTSDYNNFYTNYPYPVYWNGNRTLQSFQSSGYDSNSVEINPLFNTDSTLIPTSFRLDDKGSPISTITQDALGLARSATTPDMGAVEFTVEPLVISGAYTVGAGGDYSSLSAALRDADNYGISGAVTYNMLPGVYTDQVNFGNVFGASATNTITVQSSTGNASDVVWQPPNSNYYAFKLNGSSYVTIKNMTFNTSANVSGSKALDISNSSSYLRVEGNIFEGYNYTSTSTNHALIYCYTNYGQDIVITNNSFEEGGHGIYLNNAGDSGVKITNNSFTGMRDGINVFHTDSLQVNGNTISTSHSGYGINMYSSSYATITGNKILNTFGLGNISTGLYLGSSNGNANNRMLIANNLIEGYTNALYLNYSNYYDLYHNTLKSNSPSWYNNYATLRLHYSSNGQVKNNIIQRDSVNTSSSTYYTIYAYYSNTNMTYDYNILYNAGNGSIQNQGVSLGTNNQLNVDPGLYDGGDGFHLAAANELGTPLTEVTVDVDGEPRDDTNPDIGADEYYSPNYDGVIYIPGEIATIQGAIDVAVNNDSILVAAGTYRENIDYDGKNLTIIGEDRETTIIDGNNSGRGAELAGESILSTFTIQNGSGNNGGNAVHASGNAILDNLIITSNSNTLGNGSVMLEANTVLKNSLIVNNQDVGVVCNGADATISNVTIAGNTGAGIELKSLGGSNSHPTLINSIVYGNRDHHNIQFSAPSGHSINISYSLIQGGQDSITTYTNDTLSWGTGNLDVDPLFADTANGDYRVNVLSPVINAGHPDSTDSDGTRADMGGYPYLKTYNGPVWFVDAVNGSNFGSSGSSVNAFAAITPAIKFASSGDSINVAAGTYVENLDFEGKNLKLVGADAATTIIDGDSSGSVIRMVNISNTPSVKNFTIQNGLTASNGGGIYCSNSSPFLQNLKILNNSADSGGGLMLYDFSSPRIHNVIFKGNSASSNGSALYCWAGSSPIVRNSTFEGNIADGSVIYSEDRSDPKFINVTIASNPVVNFNSTYTSVLYASGGDASDSMRVEFRNSIIYNNAASLIKAAGNYNSIDFNYCDILGGQSSVITSDNAIINWGFGNMNIDPVFADTTNGDFSLQRSSHLIDRGHPDSTDTDGTRSDIGAYFFDQSSLPSRINSARTYIDDDSITVDWTASSDASVSSYKVYRSFGQGDLDASNNKLLDFTELSEITSTSSSRYVDGSITKDSTYHYVVTALYGSGEESLYGAFATAQLESDTAALQVSGRLYHGLSNNAGWFHGDSSYTFETFFQVLSAVNSSSEYYPIIKAGAYSAGLVSDGSGTASLKFQKYDSFLGNSVDMGEFSDSANAGGEWNHVAVVYDTDANTAKIFLNGTRQYNASGQSLTSTDISYLGFGADSVAGFSVNLDNARISRGVRYIDNFIPNMNPRVDNRTIALYRFNEARTQPSYNGQMVSYDATSNGNHLNYTGSFSWRDGVPILSGPKTSLIVNEILKDPNADGVGEFDGEWFELYNRGVVPVNLKNFRITDDGGQFINITFDVPILPGDYGVFTKNGDASANGGVDSDYSYSTSSFSLSNADDEIAIYDGNDSLVNRVAYDDGVTFPDSSGFSMELRAPYFDNSLGSNWANSYAIYGEGDRGTPGYQNDSYSGKISASQYAYDFGGIVEGNNATSSMQIYNTGLRTLMVDSLTNQLADFIITPSSGHILVGDSLEIQLQFAPTGPGRKYDTLRVYNQDNSNGLFEVSLYGLGISSVADIVIYLDGDDSVSSYEYLSTRVGFPRTEIFQIANIGNTPLDVEDISIEGGGGAFSTDVNNWSGIDLYDTIDVPVQFNPPATGSYSATLSFTSSDADEGIYTVDLSGTGSLYLNHYVPLEYSSIQSAINSSFSNDTIIVGEGSYTESIIFPDHNLVIRGDGPESTIISSDTTGVRFPTTGDPYTSILENVSVHVAANQKGFIATDDYHPNFDHVAFVLDSNSIAGHLSTSAAASMDHVTVVRNTADANGNSFQLNNSDLTVTNSILWTGANAEILSSNGGTVSVTYSTVSDSTYLTNGNVGVDPVFVSSSEGDFSLQWVSPAIDAGDPNAADMDGTVADMGAFIYNQSLQPPDVPGSVAAVSGNGVATVSWSVPVDPRGNSNEDIDSYIVYRGTQADSLVLIDTLSGAEVAYVDSDGSDYLQNGTTYYYSVVAQDTADLVGDPSDTVSVTPAGGTLVLADSAHAFGEVIHNQTSSWNLLITNSGNGTLNVSSIASNTSYFSFSHTSLAVAAGDVDTVLVTFSPDLTSEMIHDTVHIVSDDLYLNNSSITLSGQSIWPIISLSTSSIDYGDVPVNNTVDREVVVYNNGSSTLNITNIYVEDTDHFTINSGGLLASAPIPNSGKNFMVPPMVTGRTSKEESKKNDTKTLDDVRDEENRAQSSITKNTVLNETVVAGDSLVLTISFASADTGVFNTVLHIVSDDPLGNDNQTVNLAAHTTKPEMEVVQTMSVVTYKGNDSEFNVNIANTGGFELQYQVEVSANWVGFDWLTVPQASGSVSGYSDVSLSVEIDHTADLDPGAYTGYLYFNSNSGLNPTQIVRTDTVEVYMNLLEDNSQISQDSVSIPSGNAAPVALEDENGDPLGIVLDFLNSQGGTVNVTRVDASPPSNESTPFDDPSDGITDPYFARVYFEISATFTGSYAVDIGFDYSTVPGVQDPSKLRIAKRSLNAGVAEEWNIISQGSTNLDTDNGIVYAANQNSFSQWALLSNDGENSFVDVSAPTIQTAVLSPASPGALEAVTISTVINDETGVLSANLYYTQGGNQAFTSLAMSSASGNAYSATVPASEVTRNGLIYFIQAEDDLGYISNSDTIGVEINFSNGDLSTSSAVNSAYTTGFPTDKWRLISIPGNVSDNQVGNVIGDELGSQTSNTWRIFEWDDVSLSYKENPINFVNGESFWLYQKVEDNLLISAPAGATGNMSGTSLTVKPGWNLIGSPYSFPVEMVLDQAQYFGPIAYGLSGESWSDVTTELRPWSGYALYNRTTSDQTVVIDPIQSTTGTLIRSQVMDDGWQGNLEAFSGDFSDQYNQFGQLSLAKDGVDYHDNPEMVSPGSYLSVTYVHHNHAGKFTSDLRSMDHDLQVWEVEVTGKDLDQAAVLNWSFPQPTGQNMEVILLDDLNRKTISMKDRQQLELGMISDRFPRKLHIVSGPQELVHGKISELLAAIPEQFVLHQNYPNPFNPSTTLRFGLPEPSKIEFRIINILGQEVATIYSGWKDMGFHEFRWSGQNDMGQPVSNGVYFAILSNGRDMQVRKMLLVK